jgi:PAS domain S-box-containing protein
LSERSHFLEIEAKLRDRERNYSEILDILPDIVYQIDLDGHFVYVNNAVSNMGYEPSELIGQHYNILFDNSMEVDRVSRNAVVDQIRELGSGQHSPKLFDERRTGERRTEHLEVRLKYKKVEFFLRN